MGLMCILTANDIRMNIDLGSIAIDPCDENRIQPNSIDVTLGSEVRVYEEFVHDTLPDFSSFHRSTGLHPINLDDGRPGLRYLDPKQEMATRSFYIGETGWLVRPGILYLMHINETVYAPNFVMTITGKSSLARLGLIIHFTAAHGETGFLGQFTLEVSAVNHPIKLYPSMAIGQILFETISGIPEDYAAKGNYTGTNATGAVPSRSWKQF